MRKEQIIQYIQKAKINGIYLKNNKKCKYKDSKQNLTKNTHSAHRQKIYKKNRKAHINSYKQCNVNIQSYIARNYKNRYTDRKYKCYR